MTTSAGKTTGIIVGPAMLKILINIIFVKTIKRKS